MSVCSLVKSSDSKIVIGPEDLVVYWCKMGMESDSRDFVFLLGDSWDAWWKGFRKIILWYPNMKTESPPFCRWFSWTPPLPTLDFERVGANLQGHYDSFLKFSPNKNLDVPGMLPFWIHDLLISQVPQRDARFQLLYTFVSWESRLFRTEDGKTHLAPWWGCEKLSEWAWFLGCQWLPNSGHFMYGTGQSPFFNLFYR